MKKHESEDLSSDENLSTLQLSTDLEREFVRPDGSYSFKGCQLWPMTAGSDLLFNQVMDREDAPVTMFLSFIFIHLKRGGKTAAEDFEKHIIPLCWDKAKFRLELVKWMDSLGQITNDDKREALRIFEDMRGFARKSAIVPAKTTGAKKKAAKSLSR